MGGKSSSIEPDCSAVEQDCATRALGKIGGPEAIAVLTEALQDTDRDVRRRAGSALIDAADPFAIPALVIAARDAEQEVRNKALWALVNCAAKAGSYEELLPVFVKALKDPYDQVVAHACEALQQSGDSRANLATFDRILSLLGDLHDERDFPLFIESTRDDDPDVRKSAVYVLRDKRAKQAVPRLPPS